MLKSAGFEESPRINKYLALTCSVKVNLTCLTILPYLLGKLVQNKLLPWSLSFPIHSSDSSCKTRGLPLPTLILNSCGFTWKKKKKKAFDLGFNLSPGLWGQRDSILQKCCSSWVSADVCLLPKCLNPQTGPPAGQHRAGRKTRKFTCLPSY